MKEQTKKKKKRKLKGGTKVALVVVSILLVAVILVSAVYGVYKSYYGKMDYQETVQRTALGSGMRSILEGKSGALMWADHVYNVLLIGHDSRDPSEIGKSDTMILLSINEHSEEIVITSLMRDSWVYIPGIGAERLNEAHIQGGPSLLIETIEMNFHVRIDNYVMIDFFAFMDVVDALGGVEMTITDEEVENMAYYIPQLNKLLGNPEDEYLLTEGGAYTLNGIQTLAYVRCRYLKGSDFGRTERQRKVLNAIFEEFKDSSLSEMMELLDVVLPNVTTDINEEAMLSLLMNTTTEYKDYEMVQHRVPYGETYEGWFHEVDGVTKEVLSIDIETNSQYMIRDIYGVNISEEE